MHRRQRLIIADVFRRDEELAMSNLLSRYFDIEDVIDVSINVQTSLTKQCERRQKFLSRSTHTEIA